MAEAVEPTKRTWRSKFASIFGRGGVDDEFWDELEEVLIMADCGAATTETLLETVKARAKKEGARDPEAVRLILRDEMVALLNSAERPVDDVEHRPEVVLVIGVNGVGKTTTIAKLANVYARDGKKVILAAADTFRAAATEQLKVWGERIGVDVVAHKSGADPGAVVFDAVEAAWARGADLLIIDTAGRLHTKTNLMEELRKLHRIVQRKDATAPHEVLLVLDATTGQNGLQQAKAFTDAVSLTGTVLTKLDGTAKGGIVFAIVDQLGIPVRFIGTGEKADDLAPFDPAYFVDALLGE